MAESNIETRRRGPGRPFAPGRSGNPGGRPRGLTSWRGEAQRLVDELVLAAWADEIRTRGPDWLRASELLAAYAYGRPSAAVEDVVDAVRSLHAVPTERLVSLVRVVPSAASGPSGEPGDT